MDTSDDLQPRGLELPLQIDTNVPPERSVAADLVLAWARDCTTGEPRYICELDAARNGKRSDCECYSCGQRLLAINNTKRVFRGGEKRPHFRHPEGTAKASCMVLSARAAALQLLISHGYLELPARRRSFTVCRLSGSLYEAWVEQPPERVTFRHVEIRDQACAVLRLDDGRVLEVVLAGTLQAREASESDGDDLVPAIYLIVDDPHVAGMPPEELRARLELSVADAVWCRHWRDEALRRQAEEAARHKARASLDWLGGDDGVDFPDGTCADEKRETLLHLKAKETFSVFVRRRFSPRSRQTASCQSRPCEPSRAAGRRDLARSSAALQSRAVCRAPSSCWGNGSRTQRSPRRQSRSSR